MPGDGYALIQKLHDANPELLIIAISGALDASVLEATKEIGVVEVLKKPITPAWKPVVERIRRDGSPVANFSGGGFICSQCKLIESHTHLLARGNPFSHQNERPNENRANYGASKSVSHLRAPIRARAVIFDPGSSRRPVGDLPCKPGQGRSINRLCGPPGRLLQAGGKRPAHPIRSA
jgi:CheY-like chemotaxis protein